MPESTTPEQPTTPATSQAPQPILQAHTNTVVPHSISDHDTDLVQLNIWTGTKWVNIFDGNDFKNMSIDLHRVAKVVEDQVLEINKAVKGANAAMDQANKAVDSSNVNKTAIDSANKAIDEAKSSANDALDKIKSLASNDAVDKIKSALEDSIQNINDSIEKTTVDVTKIKQSQADQIKDVTGQINDAVAQAKAAADSLNARTNDLQIAIKNAQGDATVAKQTANQANLTAIDAKSDAAVATATAKQVTVDMTNVKSDVVAIKATANEATITAGNAASDAATAKVTASGAAVTATNAQNDVAEVKATADNLSTRMTSVEGKAAANATAIDQNAKSIILKADQTSVDDLGKTVSENTAQLKVQAGQISSKAESTELKKVSDKADSAIAGNAKAESDAQAASSKADTAIANDAATSAKVDKVSDKADSAMAATVKNATAIDQNSKSIALKADQSMVNNLTGEVSRAQAQLKVQANQINSKVSSTDFKTLNDKFNNMETGGRNLLHGTSDQYKTLTGSGWLYSTTARDMWTSTSEYHGGDQFTYSAKIKNSSSVPVRLALYCYGANKQGQLQKVVGPTVNSGWTGVTSVSITMDSQTWFLCSDIETLDGKATDFSIQVKDEQLEEGNVRTSWSPNPDDLISSISQNTTAINQNGKLIALKADQTTVDKINKTATDNSAAVSILNDEIKIKVDSTAVNKIIDNKGFATTNTVQSLIDQKTGQISQTIVNVQSTVDKNGKAINSTNDKLTNVTQTLDGLQTTVKNKADQSQITQLSNQLTAKVSAKDYQTEIAALEKNLNLRVQKGDVISQINLEAGGPGLIQVDNGKGKLLLDADSVVFKSKAIIPSAAIIDITADKITSGTLDAGNIRVINLTADNIHGGTLDVGDMNIKNLKADDITTGTLTGVVVKSDNKQGQSFALDNATMTWYNSKNAALIGRGISYYNGIDYDYDDSKFSILSNNGIFISNNLIIDSTGKIETKPLTAFIEIKPSRSTVVPNDVTNDHDLMIATHDGASMRMFDAKELYGDRSSVDYTTLRFTSLHNVEFDLGYSVNNDPTGNNQYLGKSAFNIQKDNKIGAYFGQGDNGDEINITAIGGTTHHTNLTVDAALQVTGRKNAIVNTTQGYIAINAYETAEYYFGDIGESQTGADGQVTIGIDKVFNETVNTTISYQVFITPYSDCHVWIDQRYDNRFIVRSDQPNARFGWELKAKRKGYEGDRLIHVDK